MRKLISIIALSLVAFAAIAQAAPQTVLSWTAPTTLQDGTAIAAGTLTYQVYAGGKPGTEVKLGAPLAATTLSVTPVAGSTQCFQVTALVGGQESIKSGEACVSPSAPTVIVITFK